jgi:hypothetical protein
MRPGIGLLMLPWLCLAGAAAAVPPPPLIFGMAARTPEMPAAGAGGGVMCQGRQGVDATRVPGKQAPAFADGGTVMVTSGDGRVTVPVPTACHGVRAGQTIDHDALVMRCERRPGKVTIERFDALGGKVLATLPARLASATVVEPETISGHILMSHADTGSVIVDLMSGKSREIQHGSQRFIAAAGRRTIITRDEDRLLLLEGSKERALGKISAGGTSLRRGHYIYVEPLVIDLRTGKVIGRSPSRERVAVPGGQGMTTDVSEVFALGADGRLLVGWRPIHEARGTATGPLEWIPPSILGAGGN